MYYTSITHFFAEHEAVIVGLMEVAQAAAGGHYAAMSPAARHENAVKDTHEMIADLRQPHFDVELASESARETEGAGIALDDITRMSLEIEARLLTYLEEHLRAQPELYDPLVSRVRHMNARFRSTITKVKIDATIRRLKNAEPGSGTAGEELRHAAGDDRRARAVAVDQVGGQQQPTPMGDSVEALAE